MDKEGLMRIIKDYSNTYSGFDEEHPCGSVENLADAILAGMKVDEDKLKRIIVLEE